jgi:hypothetical protein
MAATMKTTASTNSPATAFSAAGTGLRRRFGEGGVGGSGASGFRASIAGTSALIGRVMTAQRYTRGTGWSVS